MFVIVLKEQILDKVHNVTKIPKDNISIIKQRFKI